MTSHEYDLPELLEGTAGRALRADPDNHALASALLDDVAAYGRDLWTQLRRVADHLRAEADTDATGWTEQAWDRWQACYAGVLDTLAGPRGDSGYGAEQAAIVRNAAAR